MIKKLAILGIFLTIGLIAIAQAQDTGSMPVPVFTGAEIKADLTYDSVSGLYTYSYTVTNPSTNTGEIWDIDIDISQPQNSVIFSSEGLTMFRGFTTETFDDEIADFDGDFIPMVPVGINVPTGWGGSIGAGGTAGFFSRTGTPNILPGEIQGGFDLISRGLPTIREVEIEPDWIFVTDDAISDEEEDIARDTEKSLEFYTKTLGPTAPSYYFKPTTFLDTINGYIDQSVGLGWITDATLVDTLKGHLDSARSFINADDPTQAKASLDSFMDAISNASSSQRTTDADGLLYFNAQYLIDQLPDTSIPVTPPVPSLDLTPEDASLPIGIIHTLTPTFKLDGSASSGQPITVDVVEGPNQGLVLEAVPVGTWGDVVSYTSETTGTDKLIAQLGDLVDESGQPIYPEGVTSPPAYVTWTGGPDLTIDYFFPPVIKGSGGRYIYINEITGNHGTYMSGPSTTRYFLSYDEVIDPDSEDDIVLGEREVEGLSPEGASEMILLRKVTSQTMPSMPILVLPTI